MPNWLARCLRFYVLLSTFNYLSQMVSCAEILCWSFLECINYFSFELVSSQFSSLFLVLLGQVLLGLIFSCLFGGRGAYDMNNFGSLICVSLFLSVVFTLNMYLNRTGFEVLFCRSFNDLTRNRTQWAAAKQTYCYL